MKMGLLAFALMGLRAAQSVFAIVVLGLSGYVAHWYNSDTLTASPPQINFLLFVPSFAIVSILYLEVTSKVSAAKKFSFPLINFGIELANMLFHFVGFVSLATFLNRLLFCRGSVCMAARGDAGVASIGWVLWAASSGLTAMTMFRGRSRGVKLDKEAKAGMEEAPGPAISSPKQSKQEKR